MAKTKVIRCNNDFAEAMERGRREWQALNGRRISMPTYTAQLANVLQPFVSLQEQQRKARKG